MTGVELRDGKLLVDKPPNELDELAIAFTELLDDLDIDHVYVAGYVAILTGRARSTEDIDVILERFDSETAGRLADRLEAAGMWGPAMPLDAMDEMLEDAIWIAWDDDVVPHLEAKFVDDHFDQASLDNRITARIAGVDTALPIGSLELQIAYKLWLSGKTDFEDAVHLYTLLGERLMMPTLERWVDELGVEADYERLRNA